MGRREQDPEILEVIRQDPTQPIPFGIRLRAVRRIAEMSIGKLAKQAGEYTPSHVSRVELCTAPPSDEFMISAASALGTTPESLMQLTRNEVVTLYDASATPRGREKFRLLLPDLLRPRGATPSSEAEQNQSETGLNHNLLISINARLRRIEANQRRILELLEG